MTSRLFGALLATRPLPDRSTTSWPLVGLFAARRPLDKLIPFWQSVKQTRSWVNWWRRDSQAKFPTVEGGWLYSHCDSPGHSSFPAPSSLLIALRPRKKNTTTYVLSHCSEFSAIIFIYHHYPVRTRTARISSREEGPEAQGTPYENPSKHAYFIHYFLLWVGLIHYFLLIAI